MAAQAAASAAAAANICSLPPVSAVSRTLSGIRGTAACVALGVGEVDRGSDAEAAHCGFGGDGDITRTQMIAELESAVARRDCQIAGQRQRQGQGICCGSTAGSPSSREATPRSATACSGDRGPHHRRRCSGGWSGYRVLGTHEQDLRDSPFERVWMRTSPKRSDELPQDLGVPGTRTPGMPSRAAGGWRRSAGHSCLCLRGIWHKLYTNNQNNQTTKQTGPVNVLEITLPFTLSKIEKYASYQCTSLAKIMLPSTLAAIGEGAFEGCTTLSGITLAPNLTEI